MNGKIIGVGFQKTGTSSLREALKIMGYSVKDTCPRALIPILKGNYDRVMKLLDGYDAVEDTPWYMIYKELDERIPNSKFILTIRDDESWYNSVNRHIGDLRSAHHEWIYGRGKGLPKDDKENTIAVYNRHNEAVKKYFQDRPNDLLVLDFTQGDRWDKLCDFLGENVPEVSFPSYNKGNDAAQSTSGFPKRMRRNRKQLKSYFKIKYIDALGLWPNGSD